MNHLMIQDSLPDLIYQLKQIVDIKSISTDGEANDKVNAIVAKQIADLGFTIQMIKPERDSHTHLQHQKTGKLLLGEIKGRKKEFITLIGHSDTVNASDDFNQFSHTIGDDYAHGPGVIDCKGGLIVMLAALKAYLNRCPTPEYSLRFISSPAEETGSREFHHHLHAFGQDSNFVLGFEPAFPNGNIVNARAGNRWYHLTMQGRTAHSGRDFESGINAVGAMTVKLGKMRNLTNVKKGSTVAITYVRGGRPNYNTIPEYCEAMIDTRFLTHVEDSRLEAEIKSIFEQTEVRAYSDGLGPQFSVDVVDYCKPIELPTEHNHYLHHYLDCIEHLEKRRICADVSHGSADCNSLITDHNIFIGGLGAVGDGMHTIEEKIQLESLATRAEAAAQLLHYINTPSGIID